ncbi:type I restriction endonuclease subunit R [Candidatus Spongiihabitans sp.]|uniref:type I restriction endonuclease subunit R n=1 Tax=Candidatus Spongiihabitans sp. TaxID=3101308 RepID=UPI003C7E4949
MSAFKFNEKYLSQIPALMECINLGYTYLRPKQVSVERGGHLSNVLLENVLREQLKKINRIHYKGTEYLFSEENIQSAIQKIKNVKFEGLQKTNEHIYDLITLGSSFEQTIEDRSASYTLNYIDWKNPANNVFHVVAEFAVERMRGTGTARPDILLFVNGIPLVVIECKSPDIDVDEGISQNIRNQDVEYIPQLFTYAQVLLSVNKNKAKYATAVTGREFWGTWKEQDNTDEAIHTCVNKVLSGEDKAALFSGDFKSTRPHFEALESESSRVVTEQDKCLYSLCRPQRLLEIVHRFIIFDSGVKKIARYQQFFLVRSAIKQIKQKNNEGKRTGGIVWHTQGSGKSITMVMLARALMLDMDLKGLRIILVTDRKELDKQLGNTFQACGLDREHATSGRDLIRHIQNKQDIITTLIHKFEKALSSTKFVDESPDIIVLVDESHRTQFGSLAAGMRRMLPNVCYIGFTGTPLLKAEKNSFARFGGLIEPHYSVRQAIKDKAVVPLLYEGRHVEIEQSQDAVDLWFARHTEDLTDQQKVDLKKKYSRNKELNQTDQVIYMRAFDISTHFQSHWQGTGFKAQLVADSKVTALKYRTCLKQIGTVSSELVISPPDAREGYEEVGAETKNEVGRFWKDMMARYGSEEQYNKQIINQFKEADTPEILIVVDKLITGFDAPRNTVLYLCRKLRGHTLLQAIARVNRLYLGKEYGYIVDYDNVLGELDKALTTYDELEGFDNTDLADFLVSINERVAQLPQQHSELWDLFKEIKNSRDEEQYEVLLADEGRRDDFYVCLSKYGKTLAIALSSEKFMMQTDEHQLQDYKNDFKRFQKLKAAVKLRYAEAIDYRDYEPRIKKLLDTHIQANEVTRLNDPVNIFDDSTFTMIKEKRGIYVAKTTAARADIIAHATKRKITENLDKDPAFYEQFSKLIQDAIDDFKQQRISDLAYLQKVSDIRDRVMNIQRDDLPERIREDAEACAYFGAVKPCFTGMDINESQVDAIAAQIALVIKHAIETNWKVDFWHDSDAQNAVKNEMDDFLYDEVKDAHGIDLSPQQMDEIVSKTMKVAKFWKHG